MRIALLSDIHALADTYGAAIEAARAEGFDRIVVMGDLLSYGTQVAETLSLTDRLVAEHDAVVLRGNHDQLYFDLATGDSSYLDAKAEWIAESARWTADKLTGIDLESHYSWSDETLIEGVLISHANPFGPGNWTYIRDEASARQAAEALQSRGLAFGVFGHVHRQRCYRFDDTASLATVGSIGQPRETGQGPQWAMLTIDDDGVRVEGRDLEFDKNAHVARLGGSGMSPATVAKLAGFFA